MLTSFLYNYALSCSGYAQTNLKFRQSHQLEKLFKSILVLSILGMVSILFLHSDACALMEVPPFNADLDKLLKSELPANCEISCPDRGFRFRSDSNGKKPEFASNSRLDTQGSDFSKRSPRNGPGIQVSYQCLRRRYKSRVCRGPLRERSWRSTSCD